MTESINLTMKKLTKSSKCNQNNAHLEKKH